MKIFTKMKHMMLMAATVLCTNAAFAQDAEYGVVWSQDFENEANYTEGWTIGSKTTAYYGTRSNGSHFMNLKNTNSGNDDNTFAINTSLFTGEDWRFEFDFAGYNSNTAGAYLEVLNSSSVRLLKVSFDAAWSAPVSVTDVNDTKLGTFNCDLQDKNTRGKDIAVTVWHHVLIEGTSEGVYMTINAEDGTEEIARVKIAGSGFPAKFNLHQKNALSQWAIDNMSLSLLGAKEGVTTPSCSITNTYGMTRTITITPGVGTEGTLAEATYYTTNGDEPTKESVKYVEPFTISASCTIKVISYLPDGTASEICEFAAEAGTVWPLNSNIVKVANLTVGEGEFMNAVIESCYNNDGVLNNPSVTFSYTFNGDEITLPYTVTEDGILVATVSAEGYATQTEEISIAGAYAVTRSIDFAAMSQDYFTENYGESWAAITEGVRLANWSKSYTYYGTTLGGGFIFDDLLSCSGNTNYPLSMIFGSGVGRSTGSTYTIANGAEGDIAVYEVNKSLAPTDNLVQHAISYMDDKKMAYAAGASQTIAKVSVYSPVRELTVTEGADLAVTGTYTSATYTRTIEAGKYGTICLPFAPDAASLENYTFFTMESAADGVINFVEEEAPVANTPYIYCLKGDNEAITGGVTVVSATLNDVVAGDWTMKGSFTNQAIVATTGNYYGYVAAQNKIVKANTTLTVKPYRAYFTSEKAEAAVTLRFTRGDETTEISATELDVQPATVIYDLAGRRVEKMEKGIYIVNGKKVIR